MNAPTIILISGLPGTGKTTIVKKIVKELCHREISLRGFYTEEVRDAETNVRVGFDIEDFDGKRSVLARDQPGSHNRLPKVGKYSVFVKDFEKIALPIVSLRDGAVLIIDEIGKIELLSVSFTKEIERLINDLTNGSNKIKLIATVPIINRGRIEIVEKLKSMSGSKIFNVTKSNRDALYNEILQEVLEYTKNK